MDRVEQFLRDCVFYPCSNLHGTPIKFLMSTGFRRFLYADYSVDRTQFDEALQGIRGYRLRAKVDLDPQEVFGMPWSEYKARNAKTISGLHFECRTPYLVHCHFERESNFGRKHGPHNFELMFFCTEAIATFKAAFSRRNITPKCLVHVRSGIGFGGNFSGYPRALRKTLLENNAGLPPFMFYDRMGSSRGGDYLSLVKHYDPIKTWGYPDGGFLRLARLRKNGGRLVSRRAIGSLTQVSAQGFNDLPS